MMLSTKVQISEKLLKARDNVKSILGDKYAQTLKPYTELIQAVMKAHKLDELHALMHICEEECVKNDEYAQLKFIAATVELIAPSF